MSDLDSKTLQRVLLGMGWGSESSFSLGVSAASYLGDLMRRGDFDLLSACLHAFDPDPLPKTISQSLVAKAYDIPASSNSYGGKTSLELVEWLAENGVRAGLAKSAKEPPKDRPHVSDVYISKVFSGFARDVAPDSGRTYSYSVKALDWSSFKSFLDQFPELDASSVFEAGGSFGRNTSHELTGKWDAKYFSHLSILEFASLAANEALIDWCVENAGQQWPLTLQESLLVAGSGSEKLCRKFLGDCSEVSIYTLVKISENFAPETAAQVNALMLDGAFGVVIPQHAHAYDCLSKMDSLTAKRLLDEGWVSLDDTGRYEVARRCAGNGNVGLLSQMIDGGLDLSRLGDKDGLSLMHAARSPEVVGLLCQSGLDVNVAAGYGRSSGGFYGYASSASSDANVGVPAPFYWVTMGIERLPEMLTVAYEHGADIASKVKGRSILQWASPREPVVKEAIRSLLARGKLEAEMGGAKPPAGGSGSKPSPF